MMRFVDFFTDPVLRGPMLGSMLMCLASALVGVLVYVRKRSLLGEALSHSSYPGVAAACILTGIFSLEAALPFFILIGAFLFSLLGLFVISILQRKCRVAEDASLSATLAFFFGLGITLASYAQAFHTDLFRQIQTYLYGQAATMVDKHIAIYGLFCVSVILILLLFYKEILTISFDAQFAKTSGMSVRLVSILIEVLTALAVVIGIRSVGVILMSAMLIAPALAARQFTNNFSKLFLLSGGFGLFSGFLGNYFSIQLSMNLQDKSGLPTGPMIVLSAGIITLYALLFAPKRGLLTRYWRAVRFRSHRVQENILKTLWRMSQGEKKELVFKDIADQQGDSFFYVHYLLWRLQRQGLIEKKQNFVLMTTFGKMEGGRIVRLHRLWEAYLVNALGLGVERVHKSAEEMEHILTPELEEKLTMLLDSPKQDPHNQPIPYQEVM